jgi:hypothetical protein
VLLAFLATTNVLTVKSQNSGELLEPDLSCSWNKFSYARIAFDERLSNFLQD